MQVLPSMNEVVKTNLLYAEWISFSASVSLFGILVIFYSSLVPEGILRVVKYGKCAERHSSSYGIKKLQNIELPKRWFYHFYLLATIFYSSLAFSVYQVYFCNNELPGPIRLLLEGIAGNNRHSSVTPESVVLSMTFISAQVGRRLSECCLLSVYSDAKMNIVHYIFGHSFYIGVGLSIIAEAPGFTSKGLMDVYYTGDYIRWNYLVGGILFLVASTLQYQCHRLLANLRKDSKGQVVTFEHTIPEGGLFNLVSCPHYFAEILIYLSICITFGGRSTTWWMVCCFVVTNQVIVGLFNHHWYQETFKSYPKSRKAVIPYFL